jgi:hypothetical protein
MADNKKVVIIPDRFPGHNPHVDSVYPVDKLAAQIEAACKQHSNKLDVLIANRVTDIETLVKDLGVKIVFCTESDRPLSIRKERKDIFLVGRVSGYFEKASDLYVKGLRYLKENSCNLVLATAKDYQMGWGLRDQEYIMVIAPEESVYHENEPADKVIAGLVEMAYLRSHLTFTRSTVIDGEAVDWCSELVPANLRSVVNHCIKKNAYKVFNGATVGHFAVKLNSTTFLTSKRKTNFNELLKTGLVRVRTDGPDSVLAYGSKPSVGGQSQRIVFKEHPGTDCIVHFHCKVKDKPQDEIHTVSQREYECGSHECGQNTSTGLVAYDLDGWRIWAVMLDNHGPNIVFNRHVPAEVVTNFIDRNFDLGSKTGGYLLENAV